MRRSTTWHSIDCREKGGPERTEKCAVLDLVVGGVKACEGLLKRAPRAIGERKRSQPPTEDL